MLAGDKAFLNGDYKAAVEWYTKEDKRDSAGRVYDIGASLDICLALALSNRKVAARQRIQGILSRHGKHATVHYVVAGCIDIICGDVASALTHWQVGVKCGYGLSRSQLEVPCLLWYLNVAWNIGSLADTLALFSRLQSRVTSTDESIWPRPIARCIVDEIDEATARERSTFKVGPAATFWTVHQQNQLDFYVGIKHLSLGDRDTYKAYMKKVADAQRIGHMQYEVVLARCELKRNGIRWRPPIKRVGPPR